MDGTTLRRYLWYIVWGVAAAAALSGLPLLIWFAPKISVVAERFVVDAQYASRATSAPTSLRGYHAFFGMMLLGASVLAVALSVSRSRWRSRILTIGPAVIVGVFVADVTGKILSVPELMGPVNAGQPATSTLGSVPLSIYGAHVLGGIAAILGVIGVWAISHRAGRGADGAPE